MERLGDEISYEGNSEELERLKEMGVIDLIPSIGNSPPKAEITETGITIILNEERHSQRIKTQNLLIMLTSMYTIGTGGLVLANTRFSEEILTYLGLALVLVGISAYFLVAFQDQFRKLANYLTHPVKKLHL